MKNPYLPRIVWDRSKQKGVHLIVMLAIADYANTDGYSYPGKKTLARKCRISERYLTDIIKQLEASGELIVTRRPGAIKHRTNLYRINLPDLEAGDPQITPPGDPQITPPGDPQITPPGDPQITPQVIHRSPPQVIPRSPEVITRNYHTERDKQLGAADAAAKHPITDDDFEAQIMAALAKGLPQ